MSLPVVDHPHECAQSAQLVGIIEEQRATIERQREAVEFHRNDADRVRRELRVYEQAASRSVNLTAGTASGAHPTTMTGVGR